MTNRPSIAAIGEYRGVISQPLLFLETPPLNQETTVERFSHAIPALAAVTSTRYDLILLDGIVLAPGLAGLSFPKGNPFEKDNGLWRIMEERTNTINPNYHRVSMYVLQTARTYPNSPNATTPIWVLDNKDHPERKRDALTAGATKVISIEEITASSFKRELRAALRQ